MEFEIERTSTEEPPCRDAVYDGKDDVGLPVYRIEIDTLDELLALCDREGPLVIYQKGKGYMVEIYDTNRE